MALTNEQINKIIDNLASKVIEDIETMGVNNMDMDGMVLSYHYHLNDGKCGVMTRVFGKQRHVSTQKGRDEFVKHVIESIVSVLEGDAESVDIKKISEN